MSEYTKGLLRVGKGHAVVADHPVPEMSGSDALDYYGGHMVAESVTAANARRIIACWNACIGLSTDDLEKNGLASAFGNQLLLADQKINTLLEALNGVMGVMNNSEGVVGWHRNGDIATWGEVLPEVAAALEFAEGEQS
ncbi:hypothetical protein ACW5XW_08250 [Aeromonas piscicola]|uniref:hypothetical protein n=1 Tax=Aeromonas piscicola TaxID=600645 RepID=UPI0005B469D6|nr:hypothetical protein [Aeromonas piscicola]